MGQSHGDVTILGCSCLFILLESSNSGDFRTKPCDANSGTLALWEFMVVSMWIPYFWPWKMMIKMIKIWDRQCYESREFFLMFFFWVGVQSFATTTGNVWWGIPDDMLIA
jgi:hypothetical protein